MGRCATGSSPCVTTNAPESVNVPTAVASTSCSSASSSKASLSEGLMPTVILSCDSETSISHGERPACFNGTSPRSSTAPPVSSAISPTLLDSPPAPLSVITWIRPASLASSSMSIIFFWVIGSPIWTAELGLSSVSSRLEKVAPWIPS